MSRRHLLQENLHSVIGGAGDTGPTLTRRTALVSALVAGMPLAFSSRRAEAAAIDPKETIVVLPDDIKWTVWTGLPPHSGEMATLYGGLDKPGLLPRLDEMVSGLHERPAQLCDGSAVCRHVGHMVGEQRRGL